LKNSIFVFYIKKGIHKMIKINLDLISPVAIPLKWYQVISIAYVENKFTLPLRTAIVSNFFGLKLVKSLAKYLNNRLILLVEHTNIHNKSLRLLKESKNDSGIELESEYGYDGDVFFRELEVIHLYKKQIDENYPSPSESKILYAEIIKKTSGLLDDGQINCFFNFGCSYAYTDSILAEKYPNISFYGIERTDSAKMYNSRFFSHLNNLHFLSGDIFSILEKSKYDGGIFFHSRTLLLLPSDFIRKLYKAVKAAGFKYIVGFEQYGLSRQTMKSFEFSYEFQDSVLYRNFMFIHNYPEILLTSGFSLIDINSLKTEHSHEDFRVLTFVACTND